MDKAKLTTHRILDPCCGTRSFWFDPNNPEVIFGDQRAEQIVVTDRSHGNLNGKRILKIEPDVLLDFRKLPFQDHIFNLVVFDPPHLVRVGPKSWLSAKYGRLGCDWRSDLRQGFSECFRVLDINGVLVFKWNETQISTREVLALTDITPLFGHRSGRKTHWYVFIRPQENDSEL